MNQYVQDLDCSLAEAGEPVTLQRLYQGTTYGADIVAHVRSYRLRSEALVAGSELGQDEFLIITSPTQITQKGWPAYSPDGSVEPNVPRRGDSLVVRGLVRSIETVDSIRMGSEVVRIEMRVLG